MKRPRVRFPRTTASLRGVVLPPLVRPEAFDGARGLNVQVGEGLGVRLVPPQGLLDPTSADLGSAFADPRPWLLVREDRLGYAWAQTVVLGPTRAKDLVNFRVLRTTGRPIAEGTARLSADGEVTYEIRFMDGRARPGRPSVRAAKGSARLS